MTDLAEKTCEPCKGGVPPLGKDKINDLLGQLDGWQVEQDHHLRKHFKLPDFAEALELVHKIGEIAEKEAHHPDIYLSYGKVGVEIWTHKIDGLTESDFVLAAKIDKVAP